ncbi:MAG: hypothetical protein V1875_03565 [Candidatus Altiarchaeota archaeon]
MTTKARGQASIESMFVLGVLLMIFVMLGYTVFKNYVKSTDLKLHIAGARLSNVIADQINDLNALGDGYSSSFTLPETMVGGVKYTVNFYENESSVFVEGGGFSSGEELRFSSPLSTSRVHCIMPQCNYTCNKSSSEECLNVTGGVQMRLVKYAGRIYVTPTNNVLQDSTGGFVAAFEGGRRIQPLRAGVRRLSSKGIVRILERASCAPQHRQRHDKPCIQHEPDEQ